MEIYLDEARCNRAWSVNRCYTLPKERGLVQRPEGEPKSRIFTKEY